MNKRLTELSEAFSEEGISKLKVGQTLTFNLDCKHTTYKVMRIKGDRIWGKETILYRPEEVNITDKKESVWDRIKRNDKTN